MRWTLSVGGGNVPVGDTVPVWRPRPVIRYGFALTIAMVATAGAIGLFPFGAWVAGLSVGFGMLLSAWLFGLGPAVACETAELILLWAFPGAARPLSWDSQFHLLLFFCFFAPILFLAVYAWQSRTAQARIKQLDAIVSATTDSLWRWDLRSGVVQRSGDLVRLFGHQTRMANAPVAAWRELLHPDDRERVWHDMQRVLQEGGTRWEAEYRLSQPDGSYVTVADRGTVLRSRSGQAVHMIGGMAEAAIPEQTRERLLLAGLHDSLTGLPNRQLFRERLESVLQQAPGDKIAILFLDLDRFKTINDSLGHHAGDRVMRALAKRLEMSLHSQELASRFGGDQFLVLLENVPHVSHAVAAAERFQKALSTPYPFEGHSLVVSASIGIAMSEAGMHPEELLRCADIAMYGAKAHGRGRYQVFESSDERLTNVVEIESDIRKSLEDGNFRLHYQPIVAVESGELSGFEALLRWQHPARGILLPAEFIPLAEESGLISDLGTWALSTACHHLRLWQAMQQPGRQLTMSVNLAARQFRDPELVSQLRKILREHSLEPSALILELTENMILENNSFVTGRLQEIRNLGIRTAIDDFGRGHSSFGRLQDTQVSIIKIDGSFVRRIEDERPEIVDAVIALAKNLKLEVTAECVETAYQYEHLRRVHCTNAQGLFFSGPISAEAAAELVRSNPCWEMASAARR